MSGPCSVDVYFNKSLTPVPGFLFAAGLICTDTNPYLIDPTISIPFSGYAYENYYFIRVVISSISTALFQIAPGNNIGQRLTLLTFDDTKTFRLKGGIGFSYNGLSMNGDWLGGLGSSITFVWSGTVWREVNRV